MNSFQSERAHRVNKELDQPGFIKNETDQSKYQKMYGIFLVSTNQIAVYYNSNSN